MAASVALRDYPAVIRRVLVVDLDVHQGNGCAVLFKERRAASQVERRTGSQVERRSTV